MTFCHHLITAGTGMPLSSYNEIETKIEENIDKYVVILFSKIEYSTRGTRSNTIFYKSYGDKLLLVECYGKNKDDYTYYFAKLENKSTYEYKFPDQFKNTYLFDYLSVSGFHSEYTSDGYVSSSLIKSFIRKSEIGKYFKVKAAKFTVNIDLKIKQFDKYSVSISQNIKSFSEKYPEMDVIKKAMKLMKKDVEDLENDEITKLQQNIMKTKIEISNIVWLRKGRNLTRSCNPEYNKVMQEKIMKALCQDTHFTIDDKFYFRKKFVYNHLLEITSETAKYGDDIFIKIPYMYDEENKKILIEDVRISRSKLSDAINAFKTCIPEDDSDKESKILFLELTL